MPRRKNDLPGSASLQELADTLAASDEPGLAIGVYRDGELAESATAGCAIPEHGIPVTERTAFDIASVSKHLTAACLMLLARDGLIDLDADIRGPLPELALARPVTLRQCLTHTAGLRDYFALADIAGLPVRGITEDRFADLVTGQRDLDFPPGSAFSYSNTGYALASVVVRRVTGGGLASFARERLFGPLGMTTTHFRDDVSLLVPELAGGYLAHPPGFRRCDVSEEVVGDGAVVTSIADLAGWHSFMASGAVLGTDIRDGLLARQVLTDGSRLGYALGLESVDIAGHAAWWHSGFWAGYRAAVIYLPAQRAGVSVLANRNDWYASHVALAVAQALLTGDDARSLYDTLRGIPAPLPRARREAAAVAGLWHEPDQDVFLELSERDGLVTMGGPGDQASLLLGTDGRWHGIGTASAGLFTLQDGTLVEAWGLSARPEGSYRRVPPESGLQPPPPAGIFRNEELRAYAEISLDESGVARIVIGLAAPRTLEPAQAGAWRADDLTIRATDGPGLLVSAPGARHLKFDPAGQALADRGLLRGLSGAR